MGFGRTEIVDMAILNFRIFRQNSEFGHLRSIFLSKGHLWTLRAIFSIKTSIYGPYGLHISGRKSIFGPYGPHISGRKSIYGPSVNPFLEKSPYMDPESVQFFVLYQRGRGLFFLVSRVHTLLTGGVY